MSDYMWRSIGDGKPVKVQVCPKCGIAPANVDDCGEFGNPDCPYFGIGREELERQQSIATLKNQIKDCEVALDRRGSLILELENDLDRTERDLTAAKAENEALREAMAEFVHRCEIGEVYSRYTYSKFKGLLGRD